MASSSNLESSSSTFGVPSSPPSSATCVDSVSLEQVSTEPGKQMENTSTSARPRHSLEEKRSTRNARKKRKRLQRKSTMVNLKQQLHQQREVLEGKENEVLKYKSMAKSFWDRWQWELLRRQEETKDSIEKSCRKPNAQPLHHVVDPNHLTDPIIDEKPTVRFIGRGSFSVVRVQVYRDMLVAVKELLPHTF